MCFGLGGWFLRFNQRLFYNLTECMCVWLGYFLLIPISEIHVDLHRQREDLRTIAFELTNCNEFWRKKAVSLGIIKLSRTIHYSPRHANSLEWRVLLSSFSQIREQEFSRKSNLPDCLAHKCESQVSGTKCSFKNPTLFLPHSSTPIVKFFPKDHKVTAAAPVNWKWHLNVTR